MKKLSEAEKRAQMEFLRDARDRTGLSYDRLATLIGVSKKTIEQNAYGATRLTSRNRSELEKIIPKYSNGAPLLGRTPNMGESMRIREHATISGPRDELRRAREARRLSVKELAHISKVSAAHLEDLEQGHVQLSEKVLSRLKKALPELDAEELMSGSDSPRIIDLSGRTGTVGSVPHIALPNGQTARFVPRLADAEAGALVEWTDDIYEHEGVLALDLPPRSRAFCVKVRGDSMIPNYLPGDDVIVLWGVEPRNGQVVVACTTEGEPLIKIYNSQEQGRKVILSSYNPVHLPRPFDREELRWIWPVHSFSRQVM